jgi:molecular chaperone DnaK
MPLERPVGIDLGTTNSAMATVDALGRSTILANAEGDYITPSIVYFGPHEVVVGKNARSALTMQPNMVAQWVKRDMGARVYSQPIGGRYLPPEVIQACILRKLKEDVVHLLGPESRVVITVPAYFDELRRKATADAGEMAGLRVLDIVNEPTAAALAFGEALGYLDPRGLPRDEMNVLVYDLGGGTFDVTLLHLSQGNVRTLATDGDVQLGGHDWDARLVDLAANAFQQAYHADPRRDAASLARLYQTAMDAKHTLSARSHTSLRVEHAGQVLEVPVRREQFEELTADLLDRTAYTSRQLLATAKLQWKDVQRVLLVGGSTRMPMVARMLSQLTGLAPDRTVNPDEAVARGAAIYANYMLAKAAGGGPTTFEVTNVNAHSLGVEGIDPQTLRKINVVLIPRNSPLPARKMERFCTKGEGQRSIVIRVLEGESSLPGECIAIGRTSIRELPSALPKGWPVEVTFEYAANGRLSVHGIVPGTHQQAILQLDRETGLSGEGLSRWCTAVASGGGMAAFDAAASDALVTDVPVATVAGDWDAGPASGKGSPSTIGSPSGVSRAAVPPLPASPSGIGRNVPSPPPSPATPPTMALPPGISRATGSSGIGKNAPAAGRPIVSAPTPMTVSAPTPLSAAPAAAAGPAPAPTSAASKEPTILSLSQAEIAVAKALPEPTAAAPRRPRKPTNWLVRGLGMILAGVLALVVGILLFHFLRPDLVHW